MAQRRKEARSLRSRELCLESEIKLASLYFDDGYEDYEVLEDSIKDVKIKDEEKPKLTMKTVAVQADDDYLCGECETCVLRCDAGSPDRTRVRMTC